MISEYRTAGCKVTRVEVERLADPVEDTRAARWTAQVATSPTVSPLRSRSCPTPDPWAHKWRRRNMIGHTLILPAASA